MSHTSRTVTFLPAAAASASEAGGSTLARDDMNESRRPRRIRRMRALCVSYCIFFNAADASFYYGQCKTCSLVVVAVKKIARASRKL